MDLDGAVGRSMIGFRARVRERMSGMRVANPRYRNGDRCCTAVPPGLGSRVFNLRKDIVKAIIGVIHLRLMEHNRTMEYCDGVATTINRAWACL